MAGLSWMARGNIQTRQRLDGDFGRNFVGRAHGRSTVPAVCGRIGKPSESNPTIIVQRSQPAVRGSSR